MVPLTNFKIIKKLDSVLHKLHDEPKNKVCVDEFASVSKDMATRKFTLGQRKNISKILIKHYTTVPEKYKGKRHPLKVYLESAAMASMMPAMMPVISTKK